jgi:4-hydroxy-2-oxoheptanedioate aldolase
MQMRPSRVLEKLHAGQIASCFKINLDSVRAVEIAGMSGFDCVWLDVEHTACDWSLIQNQIYAAKSQNCDPMVRVRRGSYSEYSVPLELDAAGLMVPHIMSLEDAQKVVRITRFHPLGRRALDGGNADGAYCNMDLNEYVAQANENRFIVLQIEDPEALDDLEQIAALPGYDVLFFGAGDFSHAIGEVGNMNHPLIIETRRRIAKLAGDNGKFCGAPCGPGNIDEMIDLGYRFLPMGADVVGLNNYCAEFVKEFVQRGGGNPSGPSTRAGYYEKSP